MSRRQIKRKIFQYLASRPLGEIFELLASYPDVVVVNVLFMALCDHDRRIRWRAISCFGDVVPRIEKKQREQARIIMRRFLWSLNDESGGIGWGAPEAMAEIMVNSEHLRGEYLHMLISYAQEDGDELFQDGNFLELPMLQRGLLWGIGRMNYSCTELMLETGVDRELVKYFDSQDREVKNLALWALAGLDVKIAKEVLPEPPQENETLTVYQNGIFEEINMLALFNQVTSAVQLSPVEACDWPMAKSLPR